MGVTRQQARDAMIRAASEPHPCLDGLPDGCTHTDCYYDALLTAALTATDQGAVDLLAEARDYISATAPSAPTRELLLRIDAALRAAAGGQ